MATVDVVIIITVSCPWKASSGEAVLTLLPFSESPPLTPTGRLKDVFIPLDRLIRAAGKIGSVFRCQVQSHHRFRGEI